MASVLYFGLDDRIPKMMDQFFQDRLKETKEANSIIHVKDDQKFGEMLIGMAFEVIFCEINALPMGPAEWIVAFKKGKGGRLQSPMILVGTETDAGKIMKFIEAGWVDYIMMPPDKPLLIEKVWLHASGGRNTDIRQVYSMRMGAPADMAKTAVLEELSEFDCKLRTRSVVPLNDVMVLYSKAFSLDEKSVGQVLGRCYQSVPPTSPEDPYHLHSFYFIGISPEVLTNIRNALRKQFVSGKGKT